MLQAFNSRDNWDVYMDLGQWFSLQRENALAHPRYNLIYGKTRGSYYKEHRSARGRYYLSLNPK